LRRAVSGILVASLALAAAVAQEAPTRCPDGTEDAAALARQAMSLLPRGGAPAQRSAVDLARRLLRRARPYGATVHDVLLAADLAAQAGDADEAGELLAEGAARDPAAVAPLDWLLLARRDEARGDYASARGRYERFVKALAATDEDTRWVGPRLKQLDVAARAASVAAPSVAPPPPEARLALADGRSALARGDRMASREKFEQALRIAPGYAEAAIALAGLDAREGRTDDAIAAYRRALAFEPERTEALVQLAQLLWDVPDRAAKEESLRLLDRAAALRPDLRPLMRQSAERWAQWGDATEALRRLDAWREHASAAERTETERLHAELRRRAKTAPPPTTPAPAPVARAGSPALDEWKQASVYAAQRDDARALEHLVVAEKLDPTLAAAPELAADVHERRGDHAAAEAALRRSLAASPGRTSAHEKLALLLSRDAKRGAEAVEEWTRAEQAGSTEAIFYLAKHAEGASDRGRARSLYSRYLAEAPRGAHAAEASASLAGLEGRRRGMLAAGAAAVALGAIVASVFAYRRRSGWTVEDWLRERPSRVHTARPVLGRLQHEVLKHGGLLLRGAGGRLAASPAETSEMLLGRLFAGDGTKTRGLVAEGRRALSDLEALARSDGRRLNLGRDPLFAPIVRGIASVSSLEDPLRRLKTGAGDAALARATERLDAAADLLSETRGRDIEAMLDTIATVGVRAQDLCDLLERVASERSVAPPPVAVTGLPGPGQPAWRARMASADWETIWRNVFANTLTALSGVREPRVGLFGEVVRDRVTGEPSLRFAVADNAPGKLTTDMIRERSADRGWGVVAELLHRHGGRIAVSPSVDPRYAKRIVIELAAAPPP
jgi:tetratricopeptide (TPR) repeat protein